MMNSSINDGFILSCFPQKPKIMNTEKRLGFVGIIVEDRERSAPLVNELLSKHANIILARTGIPHIKGDNSVITLVVDCTTDELGQLTGRLGSIAGVQAKSALSKK